MTEEPRRADVALCAAGLAPSRERARQLIEADLAFCDGFVIDKPSRKIAIPSGAALEGRGDICLNISRGEFKPKKTLQRFGAMPSFHSSTAPGTRHPPSLSCKFHRRQNMSMTEEPRRADVALCAAGLAPSRERARQLIEAGLAYCNGASIDKPSRKIALPSGAALEGRGDICPNISRGEFKPKKTLLRFGAMPSFHSSTAPGILHPSPANSTGGRTCQ